MFDKVQPTICLIRQKKHYADEKREKNINLFRTFNIENNVFQYFSLVNDNTYDILLFNLVV